MSINDGICFGKWDGRHPACKKCLTEYASRCERETNRRKDKQDGENEKREDDRISFNERFLELLGVSFKKVACWGKPVKTARFYDASGKKVVYAAYHVETGQMKVVTEKNPKGKMYELSSNEEAEALAKEVLGGG